MADEEITPLTEEQLKFFSQQTNRVVRKISRRFLTGYLILLVGIGGALFSQGHDRTIAHNANQQSKKAIVRSSKNAVVIECNRQFTELKNVQALFPSLTRVIKLPDCRMDAAQITDDPDKIPQRVVPSHP